MKRFYHTFMFETFERVWSLWHQTLRYKFLKRDSKGHVIDYNQMFEDRPWYHPCCNGNRGGWRTSFCDFLEGTWRWHYQELENMEVK